jgi:hypothetical protein
MAATRPQRGSQAGASTFPAAESWKNESAPAVIIAVVITDGRREVLRMEINTSEAEPTWTEFLPKLTRPGLRA